MAERRARPASVRNSAAIQARCLRWALLLPCAAGVPAQAGTPDAIRFVTEEPTSQRKGVVGALPLSDSAELSFGLYKTGRSHKDTDIKKLAPVEDGTVRRRRILGMRFNVHF